MLVTFTCPAHENITMFGDVAQRLLHIMGHSGTVPSALSADEVNAALAKLEAAVDKERKKTPNKINAFDDVEQGSEVSLVHRALPLIAMLQDAVDAKTHVMWKKG